MNSRGVWACAALLTGTAVFPDVAVSQEAAVGTLGDVVVHARRREEPQLDVPLAVTIESGAELADQSAVLFEDVAREVPNVHMVASQRSVSALDVTIRGQTTTSSAIVYDSAVGIYVDGVYVANGQGAMATLLDVQTVEIARGVQGTLFGRNNTGGAISFRTNRPDPTAFTGEVAAQLGVPGLVTDRAILNLPLSPDLAVRLAYQGNVREGYGTSLGSDQGDFGNQNRYQARFGIRWTPAPGSEAYLTYERFEAHEVGALLHPFGGTQIEQLAAQFAQPLAPGYPSINQLFGLQAATIPDSIYQGDGDYLSHDRATSDSIHLIVDQAFGERTSARLTLGFRHVDADTAIDVDATPLPIADTTLFNTSNEKSAELQLSGASADHVFDWVTGLYWFLDDGSAPSRLEPYTPAYLAAVNYFNQLLAGQGVPPSNWLPVSPYPVLEQNAARNRSVAAFGHGEYRLTDRWAVAAGVRRTGDDRQLDENSFAQLPGGIQSCTILDATDPANPVPANGGGPCPPIHKDASFGYWSWEVSTRYRISDGVETYLRSGRGQRSGGWNAPLNTLQDTPFKPEQLTDVELGLKAKLLGGTLLLNGDVFYGNYDDMQRLLARLIAGTPTTFVTNAGRARVSGAEFEAAWRLARPVTVNASVGYTDAAYRSFAYTPQFGGPTLDLSSNRFYQTPRYTASFAVMFEQPAPYGTWRLRADYAWQDRVEFNVINDFNYQPAYGTLNARAALAGNAERWELALFSTNLGNRRYAYTGGTVVNPLAPPQQAAQIAWQIPGQPRIYGIEGGYRWGGQR